MKILKGAVVALALAAGLGSFSTAAVAGCEEGRKCVGAAQAIQDVEDAIVNAQVAATSGDEDKVKQVPDLIKKALDLSKEINANDKVDRARAKANGHLKLAIKAAKDGNLTELEEHLAKAKTGFEDLNKLL